MLGDKSNPTFFSVTFSLKGHQNSHAICDIKGFGSCLLNQEQYDRPGHINVIVRAKRSIVMERLDKINTLGHQTKKQTKSGKRIRSGNRARSYQSPSICQLSNTVTSTPMIYT